MLGGEVESLNAAPICLGSRVGTEPNAPEHIGSAVLGRSERLAVHHRVRVAISWRHVHNAYDVNHDGILCVAHGKKSAFRDNRP